jgi:hypothetical protein
MDFYFERLEAELESVLGGATELVIQKAPTGKWNSAQILEHLYLSYKGTNKAIARCLATGRPLATVATMKQRLRVLIVIGLGYFPKGVKAPAVSVPRGLPPEKVRGTILAEIQKMAAGLDDCERRFGARTKIIDHPIMGPLTAHQWRKLHWLHGRHHTRQIRERTKP